MKKDIQTYWIDPIAVAASTAWGAMYNAYGQEMVNPKKCFPVVRKSAYDKAVDEIERQEKGRLIAMQALNASEDREVKLREEIARLKFAKNMRRESESKDGNHNVD